ncbi:MAG: hypothetical protein ACO2PN_09595 [Pyrobaculum sp.]
MGEWHPAEGRRLSLRGPVRLHDLPPLLVEDPRLAQPPTAVGLTPPATTGLDTA